MKNKRVALISLGCDKNRVDAEKMLTLLKNNGFDITLEYANADIVIINTCAFLESARKEAINVIVDVGRYKNIEKIIVTGCLCQLTKEEITQLKNSLPEVDAFVPIDENDNIVEIVYNLYGEKLPKINKNISNRLISTPQHFAYLKIADGCNNFCHFCKIPYLRGRYKSVPIEELVVEAKNLASLGVKELILVAQDVTNYGIDLYKKLSLVKLLQELSKINDIEVIRLHYCYPDKITEELINEIKQNNKIAKYIDIPIQHISDNVLSSMGRHTTQKDIIDLIEKLRKEIPNIIIRTTIMVGYPGEKRKDFKALLQFLEKYKLDLVGFFAFSKEPGTKAYNLPHQLPNYIKKHRLRIIQKLQQTISGKRWGNLVGTKQKILVDGYDNNNEMFYGRNYMFSPYVDLPIYFKCDDFSIIGKFVNIKIITANENYILGELV